MKTSHTAQKPIRIVLPDRDKMRAITAIAYALQELAKTINDSTQVSITNCDFQGEGVKISKS